MASLIKLIGFLSIIVIAPGLKAQDTCMVLVPGLIGTYTGGCVNNLAHGYGEAIGEDYYIGNFRKGLPHKNGLYRWADGGYYEGEWKKGLRHGYGKYIFKYAGRDSVLIGYWEKDLYLGYEIEPPYVVEYRNNVGRVTFSKINDKGDYVRIKFIRGSSEFTGISDLLLQGTSGSENMSRAFTGFENAEFPFKGKVVFTAPNAFHSATIRCEMRYRILERGAWEVKVNF